MAGVPESVALKMIRYFGNDNRRINHALKVYSFAKIIAGIEDLAAEQRDVLEIASLLHDIGIKEAEKQYHSAAGHYQELLGPEVARSLLQGFDIPEPMLNRIDYLIGHHHTYGEIDALDFQILVEADFLVNIFEDQMNHGKITAIHEKYFKTKTGIELLTSMFTLPA